MVIIQFYEFFFFVKKNGNLVSNDFDTSLSDNESDYESDDN